MFLSVFEELYDKVIEETLKNKNFNKPTGAVFNKAQENRVNRENYSQLDSFALIIEKSLTHQPDIEYLKKLEETYAISSLSLTMIADRHFGDNEKLLNYTQKLALIELTFNYAIGLTDKYNYQFAWFESVGDFFSYIIYLVFKHRKIEISMIVHGQFPGKVAIANNEQLIWNKVESEISNIQNLSQPSYEEIKKAKIFLEDYRQNLPVPTSFSKRSLPRISLSDLKNFIRWFKDGFSQDKRYNIFYQSPVHIIWIKFRRILRAFRAKKIFDDIRKDDLGEYVFFPLHFQPEMTTLVCAPYCINQVAVIEDIAKSLPIGVRLIVKEHHGSIGRRRISDYLDIKKNWNVTLIGPAEDTMEIIKNSQAVVTINSTVGLQGFLLGIPVVTLARVGYDAGSSIIRAHLVPRSELNKVLRSAIHSSPKDQDILDFLVAVDRVLIDGADKINLEHPAYNPKATLNPENIRNISQLLQTHFHSQIKELD